ncbi:unnamed protein product [Linum tenue]|uniref:DUF7054 domain-containing protein n=1 Tax=Linum tenue TaxID=586396 RepID=A0AAV0QHG2_9ROSI|nr:unnamed protein product [Linum tenue]
MPSTGKSNRRGLLDPTEKANNRKNRPTERAVSFHGGRIAEQMAPTLPAEPRMQRPKTLPNLLAGRSSTTAASSSVEIRPLKLTKLLLNVTVQGSVGAVQVLISPESTVGDLIAAVIRQYNKEGRRPVVAADPSRFGLHYSQFSLESVEVKAGQPLKVTPEDDVILHLSHAALGEAKKTKENEFVPLFIKVGDKKLVLGTLSPETIPQLAFDLVLEQEFELSHNWKNGSIYFTGYKSILPDDEYPLTT